MLGARGWWRLLPRTLAHVKATKFKRNFKATRFTVLQCAAFGEMAERLMAADCKSAGLHLRWFESSSLHQIMIVVGLLLARVLNLRGSSSMVEP